MQGISPTTILIDVSNVLDSRPLRDEGDEDRVNM